VKAKFVVAEAKAVVLTKLSAHTEVQAATLRARVLLAAGGEERLQERGRFFGEDSRNGFDAVIEEWMREDFETRTHSATARIVGAIDQFSDARLDHGACAHGARLKRNVHRGAREAVIGEGMRGFPEHDDFGVSGGIVVANGAIAGTRDDFAFLNK